MEPVLIPLVSPNEPEATLAAVHVQDGQRLAVGDPLCTLETTKATAEVVAEKDGYVVGLRYSAGQIARAGDILCYLADSPDSLPPEPVLPAASLASQAQEVPAGLRITAPALALAQSRRLDLRRLPVGPLVTESMLQSFLEVTAQIEFAAFAAPVSAFDPQAIIVYGGGGHGKSLIDLLRALGTYKLAGVVDDGLPAGEMVLGLPVLGGGEVLPELHTRGVRLAVNAVGGIGDVSVRVKVFQKLAQAGFACPPVAHPSAVIEPSASLSAGVQVFPHAYVGSEARLGYGVIVNTGAIVSHDCLLDDYVNVSPGAMLAGDVRVGSSALIGMGVTINLGVRVGAGARIGNGATVKADVPENGLIRAGYIWPE
jgi:sugar O-acyltransferase (sialic acid O-acetyltransferase NeuD family)